MNYRIFSNHPCLFYCCLPVLHSLYISLTLNACVIYNAKVDSNHERMFHHLFAIISTENCQLIISSLTVSMELVRRTMPLMPYIQDAASVQLFVMVQNKLDMHITLRDLFVLTFCKLLELCCVLVLYEYY